MTDRDYEVFVSDNEKYIIIKISSPMTVDLGRRCGSEAAELGKRRTINRYLFDSRGAQNVEKVLPNYDFAYKGLESFGFPRNSRSALLVDPQDKTHDFMETLFLNAGYEVKLFHDEAAAVAWLSG